MADTRRITEPGVPIVVQTSELGAPRELVSRAHIEPELPDELLAPPRAEGWEQR